MKYFILSLLLCFTAVAQNTVTTVNNITELMKLTPSSTKPQVSVLGLNVPSDGRGGVWYWSATSTNLTNTVEYSGPFARPYGSPTGRWIKEIGLTETEIPFMAGLRPMYPKSRMVIGTALQAALTAKSVRVSFVGDSITLGAHAPYPASWAHNLGVALKNNFSDITWTISNYGIGGRGTANLKNPAFVAPGDFSFPVPIGGDSGEVWPGGSVNGVSWLDHVKNSQPDILFFTFGMNEGNDTEVMRNNVTDILSQIALWPKQPTIVIGNEHLSTRNTALWSLSTQEGQQSCADMMRYLAIERNYGLIDMNAWFRFARDSARVEFPVMKWEQGWDGTWLTNGVVTGTGNRDFAATGASMSRLVKTRDINVGGYYALVSSSDIIGIFYRQFTPGDTFNCYTVQIGYNTPTTAFIRCYYRGNFIKQAAVTVANPLSGNQFQVIARGDHHEVWLNGKFALGFNDTSSFLASAYGFGSAQGHVIIAADQRSTYPETVNLPLFTDVQLFGTNINGLYPYTDGGNSINHISIPGESHFAIPAVTDFVSDFRTAVSMAAIVAGSTPSSTITDARLLGTTLFATPNLAAPTTTIPIIYKGTGQLGGLDIADVSLNTRWRLYSDVGDNLVGSFYWQSTPYIHFFAATNGAFTINSNLFVKGNATFSKSLVLGDGTTDTLLTLNKAPGSIGGYEILSGANRWRVNSDALERLQFNYYFGATPVTPLVINTNQVRTTETLVIDAGLKQKVLYSTVNVTASTNTSVYEMDSTAADRIVTLPLLNASLVGVTFTINKISTANKVQLVASGANTIDGSPSKYVWGSTTLYTDGTFWHTLADSPFTGTEVADITGTVVPEGNIPAAVGSTYRKANGGAGTAFYVKETGGNTVNGWVAYGAAGAGSSPLITAYNGVTWTGAGTDTAENPIFTTTLPANVLATDWHRMRLDIPFTVVTGGSITITVRIKLGSGPTTLYEDASATITGSGSNPRISMLSLIFTRRSATAVDCIGYTSIGNVTAATIGLGDFAANPMTGAVALTYGFMNQTPASFNWANANNTLAVTMQASVAGSTIQTSGGHLVKLQ